MRKNVVALVTPVLFVLGCGSSSSRSDPAELQPADECSLVPGEYDCSDSLPSEETSGHFLLSPSGGRCSAGATRFEADGNLVVAIGGVDTVIGTWWGKAAHVTLCEGNKCADCISNTYGLDVTLTAAEVCDGFYDCSGEMFIAYGGSQTPPTSGGNVASAQVANGKFANGACSVNSLEYSPDGRVTFTSGQQIATWSGDAHAFKTCYASGDCVACTLRASQSSN